MKIKLTTSFIVFHLCITYLFSQTTEIPDSNQFNSNNNDTLKTGKATFLNPGIYACLNITRLFAGDAEVQIMYKLKNKIAFGINFG